jgi:Fe-S-cluster containining protein
VIRRVVVLPFECQQCGECCSHLGLVHKVREDFGEYRFLIYNQYTGEETAVAVDSDKTHLYDNKSVFSDLPEACPFFRFESVSRKGCCTVHQTRPGICRDYGCWRLLILDRRGRRVGRISNQRMLCSEDTFLTRLWEGCIDEINEPDDKVWEEEMICILSRAGFTVRR